MADAAIGLIMRNPDHWLYAKHYVYHIARFCLGKTGMKIRPATLVRDRSVSEDYANHRLAVRLTDDMMVKS
jgi:hypothetical protein